MRRHAKSSDTFMTIPQLCGILYLCCFLLYFLQTLIGGTLRKYIELGLESPAGVVTTVVVATLLWGFYPYGIVEHLFSLFVGIFRVTAIAAVHVWVDQMVSDETLPRNFSKKLFTRTLEGLIVCTVAIPVYAFLRLLCEPYETVGLVRWPVAIVLLLTIVALFFGFEAFVQTFERIMAKKDKSESHR